MQYVVASLAVNGARVGLNYRGEILVFPALAPGNVREKTIPRHDLTNTICLITLFYEIIHQALTKDEVWAISR